MRNKLKCPFCETELEQGIELQRGGHILGCPKCKRNADDIFWFALIKNKKYLDFFMEEQDKSATALVERTKELDKCQKDLEIATKALLDAKQTLFYCWDDYNIIAAKCTAENVEKILEQINQKNTNETSQNQNA